MTLQRYITRQIIWPTLAALLALNGLFLVIQLLKVGEIAFQASVQWKDLIKTTLLFLPGFCVFTIPIAVLIGILLGLGRMAEDGELVAFAAGGISPLRLLLMPLVLGFVSSLSTCWLSIVAAPSAANELHRTFVDFSKKQVVASLNPGHFFEEVQYVVFYPKEAGQKTGQFDGLMIYTNRPNESLNAIFAKRARLVPLDTGNVLKIELEDGQVHTYGKQGNYSIANFKSAAVGLDIDRLISDRTRFLPPVERLGMAELLDFGEDLTPRDKRRRLTTWHRRIATPFTCLVFAVLASAVGISGRLRGPKVPLVAAVGIVAIFYFLMRLNDAAIDQELLSPILAAWTPAGIVFSVSLIWLVIRIRAVG